MFINYIMCIYHKLVTPKLLYNMIDPFKYKVIENNENYKSDFECD